MIELVEEAAAHDGAAPFELSAVERLLELVSADRAGYYEFDETRERALNRFYVCLPGDAPEVDWASQVVEENVASWPLRDSASSGSTMPLKLSDFLTRSELQRNPWFQEVMRPLGVEFQMKVWLPAPRPFVRGFFVVRELGRGDFTERDRAVLALLRPHLASIRDRWERRHHPSVLTPRETEVLRLVSKGLTNGEVAAKLVISRGTVRAHLENVYEKLGVHTRTAAVAWLNELGKAP